MSECITCKDLPPLNDIFDKLEPTTNSLLTCDDEINIEESASILIDAYIKENILTMHDPAFHDNLFNSVYSILELQFVNLYAYDIEDRLVKIVSQVIYNYFGLIIPKRSYKKTFIRVENPNYKKLQHKIKVIEETPQPDQRTDEWYQFRHNLITASSAWKALDTQSLKNQLIYEKCKPLDLSKYKRINTESPLHWGQKYEDVSIAYYEYMYDTVIRDYGCIQHSEWKFLGASPDGINVKKNHPLYGRMLEIKNIVNRDITGIPKREYWIQMQLQMETCNLNECDFLETRFKEYASEEDFNNDGVFQKTTKNKQKGIMLYFMKEGKPHYEYAPFNCTKKEYEKWEEEMHKKNENLTWVKNIYWRLDEISCVLVLRNKEWFQAAITEIGDIWDIIEKERVEGYEHRAPKKNNRKSKAKKQETKIDNVIKINTEESCFTLDEQNNPVLKIRTQSFDSTTTNED